MIFRPLPLLTAFSFLLVSGLAHGLWTSRWEKSHSLEDAAERVAQVPLSFGDWKGRELETEAEEFAQAGCESYWMRRYENSRGMGVSAILMCGPGGRMSVHTPDVCYGGAGYVMTRSQAPFEVSVASSAEPAHFWTSTFQKESAGPMGQLRLYWCWGARGQWQAPDRPRWTFRGEAALYKLYVIQESPANEPPDAGPAAAFLKGFLPELNKVLFAPPSS